MRVLVLGTVILLVLAGCTKERPTSSDDPSPRVSGSPMSGTVTGRVLDSGRPVAEVSVRPEPLFTPAPAIPELLVVTDAEGRYVWSLPAGRYRMTARLGERSAQPVDVTVVAGETVTADLLF
ncbi:carboxypeptidase-like regulatory domain-containing protein [Longispora albida]|uniref:carboxypeptidase-like regulatory domain-containing protein n=1 Tax=Longispora albida TaxID=203523 RepID=UPI00037D8C8D|nr:carboxypeptidase-like regulatory domain-containing protein [Longispora albida]